MVLILSQMPIGRAETMLQSSIMFLTNNLCTLYQIVLRPSRPTAQSKVGEPIHTHLHDPEHLDDNFSGSWPYPALMS